jgi:hypothetical protein
MRPQIGADAVNPLTTSAFNLPERLAAKADPALIADDEQHFAASAESLAQTIAEPQTEVTRSPRRTFVPDQPCEPSANYIA